MIPETTVDMASVASEIAHGGPEYFDWVHLPQGTAVNNNTESETACGLTTLAVDFRDYQEPPIVSYYLNINGAFGCNAFPKHPLCSTVFVGEYFPQLAIPASLSSIDPAWGRCHQGIKGLYDPPVILGQQSIVASPTLDFSVSSTATPTPSLTAKPVPITNSMQRSSVSTAGWTSDPVDPPSAYSDVYTSSAEASNPPSPSPDGYTTNTEATDPVETDPPPTTGQEVRSSSPSDIFDPTSSSVVHTDPVDPPDTTDSVPSNAYSTSTFDPTAAPATSGGLMTSSAVSDPYEGDPSGPTTIQPPPDPTVTGTIATSDSQSVLGDPSNSATIPMGTQSFTQNGAPQTVDGVSFSYAPDVVVSDDVTTVALATDHPSSQNALSVLEATDSTQQSGISTFTAGSQVFTIQESDSTIVVGGQTLSAGGFGATFGGNTISAGPSDLVVQSGTKATTIPLATAVDGPSSEQVTMTINSQAYTAYRDPNGNVVFDGATLSLSGPALTLDGQQVGLAPGGIALGSDATTTSQPSPRAILTVGSQTFIEIEQLSGTEILANSQTTFTLSAGGSAATIAGQQLSALSSGALVIGTGSEASTVALAPAAADSLLTIGSQVFTAVDSSGGTDVFENAQATFTLSQAGDFVTVDGQMISAASSGNVVIGSGDMASTVHLGPDISDPTCIFTLGSQTLTAVETGGSVLIGSQTIQDDGVPTALTSGLTAGLKNGFLTVASGDSTTVINFPAATLSSDVPTSGTRIAQNAVESAASPGSSQATAAKPTITSGGAKLRSQFLLLLVLLLGLLCI